MSSLSELQPYIYEKMKNEDGWDSENLASRWTVQDLCIVVESFHALSVSEKTKILLSIIYISNDNRNVFRSLFNQFIDLSKEDCIQWIVLLAKLMDSFLNSGAMQFGKYENFNYVKYIIDDLKEEIKALPSDEPIFGLEHLNKSILEMLEITVPSPKQHFFIKENYITKVGILRENILEEIQQIDEEEIDIPSPKQNFSFKENHITKTEILRENILEEIQKMDEEIDVPSPMQHFSFMENHITKAEVLRENILEEIQKMDEKIDVPSPKQHFFIKENHITNAEILRENILEEIQKIDEEISIPNQMASDKLKADKALIPIRISPLTVDKPPVSTVPKFKPFLQLSDQTINKVEATSKYSAERKTKLLDISELPDLKKKKVKSKPKKAERQPSTAKDYQEAAAALQYQVTSIEFCTDSTLQTLPSDPHIEQNNLMGSFMQTVRQPMLTPQPYGFYPPMPNQRPNYVFDQPAVVQSNQPANWPYLGNYHSPMLPGYQATTNEVARGNYHSPMLSGYQATTNEVARGNYHSPMLSGYQPTTNQVARGNYHSPMISGYQSTTNEVTRGNYEILQPAIRPPLPQYRPRLSVSSQMRPLAQDSMKEAPNDAMINVMNLLKIANRISNNDKGTIMQFLTGNTGNPTPELGAMKEYIAHREIEVHQMQDSSLVPLIVDTLIHLNYDTLEVNTRKIFTKMENANLEMLMAKIEERA